MLAPGSMFTDEEIFRPVRSKFPIFMVLREVMLGDEVPHAGSVEIRREGLS